MRISLVILLLLSMASPAVARIDTLRHYNPEGKQIYFRDDAIRACVARFEPAAPGYLTDVYITLGGRAEGRAVVRIYGNEGGGVVPVMKNDMTGPVTIHKTHEGPERLHIKLPERLAVYRNQFFVEVGGMSEGVYLVSDSERRTPSCLTEQGAQYFYQFVELSDGEWRSYHAAFRIDAVLDYFADTSPKYLEDVTTAVGIDSSLSASAIAWSDINGDAFPDLLVDGRLYENRAGAGFQDITGQVGLRGSALAYAFVDMNNDEAVDILFLGCRDNEFHSRLYLNTGAGRFREQDLKLPVLPAVISFSIADINGDRFPDMFVGQRSNNEEQVENYLFLNTGTLEFNDISDSLSPSDSRSSGQCNGSMWVDYNNDGRLDLYITNSDGMAGELWRNEGGLSFTSCLREAGLNVDAMFNAIGCDWADYDNDGDADLIMAHSHPSLLVNKEYRLSTVFVNSGAPLFTFASGNDTFTENLLQFEERQAGGAWGDVNNDGLLDLLVTTVSPCHFNELYIQQEEHNFAPETFNYGLWKVAEGDDAVWIDFNNDGRLDLATGQNGIFRLFQNKSNSLNNSLQFDLRSSSSNSNAIGGRVTVYAGGEHYIRDIVSGRGLRMQGAPRVHIGLGDVDRIDSVIAQWPNGTSENFGAVDVNALYSLREGRSSEAAAHYSDPILTVYPNPLEEEAAISYSVGQDAPIRLAVYSLANRIIRTLVAERQAAGEYTVNWDGRDEAGIKVASGMYLIRVQVGNRESAVRIIVNE